MNHAPGEYLHHFHGGLKLRHYKQISCTESPQRLALPALFTVPVSQQKGANAHPLVEVGEIVLRGQLIAKSVEPNAQYIHAPSSGKVVSIAPHTVAQYQQANSKLPAHSSCIAIVIECDGQDRSIAPEPIPNWQTLSSSELTHHICTMGIVGLGGAAFSTAEKLHSKENASHAGVRAKVDTIILNGAECEPYLSCDESLMLSEVEAVLQGAIILAHAAEAENIVIAIEDRMNEVKKRFEDAIQHVKINNIKINNISVVQVPTYYPEGGERQLIQVLTGLEVPHQGLPRDLGVLCFNVATAAATYQAVVHGQPLIERLVTITGHCVTKPSNWWVRIGTPITALVEAAGGFQRPPEHLIMGGPMMGIALPSMQVPIVKASNCILALTAAEVQDSQGEMPCINCGFCIRVCPAQLLPQELHWSIRSNDITHANNLGLTDCIECGCCDQVCPSHINLVDDYRLGKHLLRVQEQNKLRAQQAKKRFEARQKRLEQQALELKERRESKKKQNANFDAKSRIAAALAKKKKHTDNATNTTTQTDNERLAQSETPTSNDE